MWNLIKNWFNKPKQVIVQPEPYKKKFSEEEYQDWFIEYVPFTGYYFAKNKYNAYIYNNCGGDIVHGIKLSMNLTTSSNKELWSYKSKTKDDVLKAIDGYLLYQKLTIPEIIKV